VRTLDDLGNAHSVIGRRWSPEQSPEQERILVLARSALDFISATGQRYDFEDFFKKPDSGGPPLQGGTAELKERMDRTRRFFEKVREAPEFAEEVAQSQAILDTLRYIESTDLQGAFADYLEHVEANAPYFVVASFDTREEAETWLASHPHPPSRTSTTLSCTTAKRTSAACGVSMISRGISRNSRRKKSNPLPWPPSRRARRQTPGGERRPSRPDGPG